ncbi:MAG: glycosyltransferase family 39 protein [Anaerolineae bacterium]|nr:glycosyltransferase family 39 protein [Anaerolineae bacterium]
MTDRKNNLWPALLTVTVLLLATGLRYATLDRQSFWNDEGNTARLVERSVALIIEGAAGDIHPPGYYLVLHLWRAAAGASEFALRSTSALCGILTVAVAISLGRQAGGRRSAIGAGLMVALHPLSVYYSQEARMYAQLGLCTALTLWMAVALLRRGGERAKPSRWMRPATGFALCIAAGLYTQYTYILALVALNAAFGLWWITQRSHSWRLLGQWILSHAAGGILFLPWAPIALGAAGWRPPDLSQGEAGRALSQTLFVGTTLPDAPLHMILPVAGCLALLALACSLRAPRRSPRRFVIWAALSIAILPAAILAAAGLYRPAYLKFLMMSLAPLAVALTVPLGTPPGVPAGAPACSSDSPARTSVRTPADAPVRARLRRALRSPLRRWRLLGAAALLLGGLLPYQIQSLEQLYTNPAYVRDDYRGIAAQIRAQGRPRDAILLSAPNQWEVFTYYYGSQPADTLPVYPAPYRPTQTEAEAWITDIIARHTGGRLVVLFWGDAESDPERLIERALSTQAYKAGDTWITTVRLAWYGTGTAVPEPDRPLEAHFGEGIRLVGSDLPDTEWAPGDIVPLTLFWKAETTPEERLKVFVHLIDGAGTLVAQTDAEPGAGFAPTLTWQPGETIVDR